MCSMGTSISTISNDNKMDFHDDMMHQNIKGRNDIIDYCSLDFMDGKRMRKAVFRRTIDYNSSVILQIEQRLSKRYYSHRTAIQPDMHYQHLLTPPMDYKDNPTNCVCVKHVRTSTNKNKCPIYSVCWTPDGRRLITGASSGEFTLWNGLTFNFETILQAHETHIKAMKWSHNEEWLLSGDDLGMVKYWQANMNDVNVFQAHKDSVRGVSFCPSDKKFVTCSVDNTVRIWDFQLYKEERVLRGHGGEVKCVSWHPTKSLVFSGSKDSQQPIKLWDPKAGECISTMYVHKSTCNDISINKNGNWFLTASKDNTIKLFDLRNLKKEMQVFRGHKKDFIQAKWHPFHENLFASGSGDGVITYWMVGNDVDVGSVDDAHDNIIWSLDWHPIGHILASGSNDFATKFWSRNRPGDLLKDNQQVDRSIHSTKVEDVNRNCVQDLDHVNEESSLAETDLQKIRTSIDTDRDKTGMFMSEIPGLSEGMVLEFVDDIKNDYYVDKETRLKGTVNRLIPKQFASNWTLRKGTHLAFVVDQRLVHSKKVIVEPSALVDPSCTLGNHVANRRNICLQRLMRHPIRKRFQHCSNQQLFMDRRRGRFHRDDLPDRPQQENRYVEFRSYDDHGQFPGDSSDNCEDSFDINKLEESQSFQSLEPRHFQQHCMSVKPFHNVNPIQNAVGREEGFRSKRNVRRPRASTNVNHWQRQWHQSQINLGPQLRDDIENYPESPFEAEIITAPAEVFMTSPLDQEICTPSPNVTSATNSQRKV